MKESGITPQLNILINPVLSWKYGALGTALTSIGSKPFMRATLVLLLYRRFRKS